MGPYHRGLRVKRPTDCCCRNPLQRQAQPQSHFTQGDRKRPKGAADGDASAPGRSTYDKNPREPFRSTTHTFRRRSSSGSSRGFLYLKRAVEGRKKNPTGAACARRRAKSSRRVFILMATRVRESTNADDVPMPLHVVFGRISSLKSPKPVANPFSLADRQPFLQFTTRAAGWTRQR